MRRIPRLRQPSGLSASLTRSTIAPLVGQPPSASSPHTSASSRRPIPTSLQRTAFARLYSTEKRPNSEIEQPQNSEPSDSEEEQQWTTFTPPPRRRLHAERADEITSRGYEPAMTDEGLEVVGGTARWWESYDHWPQSADFVSFRPRRRAVHPAVMEATVRRAVVEAFALRQAGREEALVAKWPVAGDAEMRRVFEVEVAVEAGGAVKLTGDVEAVLGALRGEQAAENVKEVYEATEPEEEYGDEEIAEDRPAPSVRRAEKHREAWGDGWKAASLSDPRIKFAVTKRIFQLTGHLVQDSQISGITDVKTLLYVVQKQPKPRTLTQEIQETRQDLVQLPNVFVATKRITRGDKEKMVGRFKLIEEEFKKRELPLTGHGFASKNLEVRRLRGEK
ncbi:ribosomal subunit 39S-domain-containing protein [Annulohypoxylon bovei var. microspora]|nr:ribosomal subunit 39S-domain-containing protein [Annulohypoxylon bovei var. microspora]